MNIKFSKVNGFLALIFFLNSKIGFSFGSSQICNENLNKIYLLGPANLSDVKVKQYVKICGPTTAKKVFVDGNFTIIGPCDFNDLKAKEVIITGPVPEGRFCKAINIEITGPTVLNELDCQNLRLIGPCNLKNSSVKNECKIVGSASISETSFCELHIWSDNAVLDNCKISGDLIFHKNNPDKKQVLHLKNKTEVVGKVILESCLAELKKDNSVIVSVISDVSFESSKPETFWEKLSSWFKSFF